MVTIFTIPKPFQGHNKIIQRNAIQSWLKLRPKCEIILFGDDEGVVETAKELCVNYIPSIEKNEFDTPLLNSAFKLAKETSQNPFLMYVNADIILMDSLVEIVNKVKFPLFLLSGRRWDLDIEKEINFTTTSWKEELDSRIKKKGILHGYSGIDYFVFPKKMPVELPEFAVGRIGWDNWMIYHAIHFRMPVVDITPFFKAIHQNHDYSHLGCGQKQRDSGEEAKLNLRHAGGWKNLYTIRDATHQLTLECIRERKGFYSFCRRLVNKTGMHWMYRLYVAMRRMINTGLK